MQRKPRSGRAFVVPGGCAPAGSQFRVTTPLATGEQPVFPSVPHSWEATMSVHYEQSRDRWVMRWRESGRQRSRTVANEADPQGLDRELNQPRTSGVDGDPPRCDRREGTSADQGGVYPYETSRGTRWRFIYQHADRPARAGDRRV